MIILGTADMLLIRVEVHETDIRGQFRTKCYIMFVLASQAYLLYFYEPQTYFLS